MYDCVGVYLPEAVFAHVMSRLSKYEIINLKVFIQETLQQEKFPYDNLIFARNFIKEILNNY